MTGQTLEIFKGASDLGSADALSGTAAPGLDCVQIRHAQMGFQADASAPEPIRDFHFIQGLVFILVGERRNRHHQALRAYASQANLSQDRKQRAQPPA